MKPRNAQDYSDLIAYAALMEVFAVFAWKCLGRACKRDGFLSARLLMAFLTLGIFSGDAYYVLSDAPRIDVMERAGQAHDRLTGGFVLTSVMIVLHTVLYFRRRSSRQTIESPFPHS